MIEICFDENATSVLNHFSQLFIKIYCVMIDCWGKQIPSS